MNAILIPVKRFALAKLRLSDQLEAAERLSLGTSMLRDVLSATSKWQMRFVVTDDPQAAGLGREFGCGLVADPGQGLNSAIRAGTKVAVAAGCDKLLVLPCDVPLVATSDITKLFSLKQTVAIAASRDGGTNALMQGPPGVIEPAFGPRSAAAHQAAAKRAGVTCTRMTLSSLELDIDTYSDLAELSGIDSDRLTIRVARKLAGRRLQI